MTGIIVSIGFLLSLLLMIRGFIFGRVKEYQSLTNLKELEKIQEGEVTFTAISILEQDYRNNSEEHSTEDSLDQEELHNKKQPEKKEDTTIEMTVNSNRMEEPLELSDEEV